MNYAFRYLAEEIHITPELQEHTRLILEHPIEWDEDYGSIGDLCNDESQTFRDIFLQP